MQQHVLYGGAVVLSFDEGPHQYWLGEELIPSPSRAFDVVRKPALEFWKVKVGKEAFLNACPPGTLVDEVNREEIADAILWAHRGKQALTIGKKVHEYAEDFIAWKAGEGGQPPNPVNEEVKNGCRAFFTWFRDSRVEPISTEQVLYSREHRYAGTADLLCKMDGKEDVWCIDYKTSADVYPEYRMQVSAYAAAYEEELGFRPRRGVVLFPKDGKAPKFVDLDEIGTSHAEDQAAFLNALSLYRWQEAQKKRA